MAMRVQPDPAAVGRPTTDPAAGPCTGVPAARLASGVSPHHARVADATARSDTKGDAAAVLDIDGSLAHHSS